MILEAIFKRLFHFREMILILTLSALACLPLALSALVRDASLSLLLPLTLLGALLAWGLAQLNARGLASAIVLLVIGPLALYVRIGQLGGSLFEVLKQTLELFPALINLLLFKTPFELSAWSSAGEGFAQKAFTLGDRLTLWFTGILHGIQIEDPVVRTLIWSLVLWLIAVWAGWQVFRNRHLLAGMLPSTVVLAFVLDYTSKKTEILWIHLALLLFLYGLTGYANLQARWNAAHTDYSESTGIDTLAISGALTAGLVAASFLASTISIRDILENLRDRNQRSNASQAQALGLEAVKNNFRITGFDGGLPRSYLVSAGPGLSRQLAMTISTGDLPSMPASARPIVPRYYWRTMTYQIYTGSGWTNPPASSEDVAPDQALVDPPPANYRVVDQTVTFPNDTGGRLYWTGALVRADVPFQAAWIRKADGDALLDSDLLAALAPVGSYRAESLLLNVTANDLRKSPSAYPDWVRERFLELPDSVPERVLALARDLTASAPTAYDRAIAIQNTLREFPYKLDVASPPAGREVADYFLFDLKQGYCDYYATTMIVLARAAGLPARLVVGYANGSYDVERAHYTVTENYAHSWVEIYFANIGWVEFEPTASELPILYADTGVAGPSTEAVQTNAPFTERFTTLFRGLNLWIPALSVVVLLISWIGWDSLRVARLEPGRAIQLLYARLRRLARPVSGTASMDQTAHQFASALGTRLSVLADRPRLGKWLSPSHSEVDELTELYARSLFAPAPPTRMEARGAVEVWSRLRWRLILANLFGSNKR